MKNCQIVFQRAYPIHIFINSIGEIQFLHILFNMNYYLFFIVTQTLVSSSSLVAKSCPTLMTPWTEELGRLQLIGLPSQTRLRRLSTCTIRNSKGCLLSISQPLQLHTHYPGYVLPSPSTAAMLAFLACMFSLLGTLFHHVFKSCFPLLKKSFGWGQFQE